ncbi:MAG: PIN domain-containing protein [Dehalococcoidia bacterium]
MILVVDASGILRELLSRQVPRLLVHPDLDLLIAEHVLTETDRNLERRAQAIVQQGRLTVAEGHSLVDAGRAVIESTLIVVARAFYAEKEIEARQRLESHCRDRDWPNVALALLLGRESEGIWTEDRDYWGCGCPTWSTAVLRRTVLGQP